MKPTFLQFFLPVLLLLPTLRAEPKPPASEREARAHQATEQRLAHAASAKYNPYDTENRDIRKAAYALLDQKKPAEAIACAEKGLARFPCDIELRMILAGAWREAGDQAKADQFQAEWMGLVDSILQSGSGRDYASAFRVISVDEEYCVLRVLRLQVTKQALDQHDGSAFDLMTVKRPESGAELTLYFNIDLPSQWLTRQFAAPVKK